MQVNTKNYKIRFPSHLIAGSTVFHAVNAILYSFHAVMLPAMLSQPVHHQPTVKFNPNTQNEVTDSPRLRTGRNVGRSVAERTT